MADMSEKERRELLVDLMNVIIKKCLTKESSGFKIIYEDDKGMKLIDKNDSLRSVQSTHADSVKALFEDIVKLLKGVIL